MGIKESRKRAAAFLTAINPSALALSNDVEFSPFNPIHEAESARLVKLFWSIADSTDEENSLEQVLNTAEAAAQSHGTSMARHALMIFATHHTQGRKLILPTFFERYPDLSHALSTGRLALGASGPEQALDWWREDPFFNQHHEHWHIVYRPSGVNGVMKDRHGELFLYMHQQMLARYDTERVCTNLPPVTPLEDYSTPIPEDYTPLGLALPYTSRPANQPILDLPDGNGGTISPQILANWRNEIDTAISQGKMLDDFGNEVSLNKPEDIDTLGNVLEANNNSVSRNRYGNLHNTGHGFIALSPRPSSVNQPQGVMGFPWVSAMDPVFWRWHRMIDNLGAKFQERLPSLDFSDVPESMNLREIDLNIVRGESIPNFNNQDLSELTLWAEQNFGGANWDFDLSGETFSTDLLRTFESTSSLNLENTSTPITLTYGDHEDFAYILRIENTKDQARNLTIRIWICLEELAENRRAWIELDTFEKELGAHERKVIFRSARESSVVRKKNGIAPNPPILETAPGASDQDSFDDDYCECGWPYTLLLPRGSTNGKSFVLMVMVTENDVDMQGHTPSCGSVKFCGARNLLYPDKRPMGYPFNQNWGLGKTIPEWIEQNHHMVSKKIQIQFT